MRTKRERENNRNGYQREREARESHEICVSVSIRRNEIQLSNELIIKEDLIYIYIYIVLKAYGFSLVMLLNQLKTREDGRVAELAISLQFQIPMDAFQERRETWSRGNGPPIFNFILINIYRY